MESGIHVIQVCIRNLEKYSEINTIKIVEG